ncbi:MAG TPA: anti-sigma factor [Kouleothrix sp.]|uniref:anti-sigma factor n=1 Tax=Kouleothrix sp. TaxID=2779161 RepID=UPI002C8A3713|nr:anti-sigma factor [Kouleothrix sp.]
MTTYESATAFAHHEYGDCALVQDLLPLYLEGEVSSASRDTIVDHLARCERCAAFLAGAQSVHAQLRRDRGERERVILGDAPTRQSLRARQGLVSMIAMLILCSLGTAATLMLWIGINDSPPMFPGGAILGLAALGGLVALARRSQPMTLPRWVVLLASCMLGALAVLFIVVPHQLAAMAIGMLLLLLALSGIWTSVFHEPRHPAE